MKRASYREAVMWLALNDEAMEFDVDTIDSFVTTKVIADIFGVPSVRVARDILRKRKEEARNERRGKGAA